ncbi:EamA family transporter [Cohnella fermenti]|uniref:EamA family transporter n=1 Tax=Cohnella fermenti TaxID=2565925 RepID=A0A4S4BNF6_9BACL|nr:EamA family transporter [Cohnella fermenti]THF74046.1 EamA family transporter [Cohnella fermenti]
MWFIFGLAAASCFGLRGILYQWTSQRKVNRSALLFGVYLSGALVAAIVNAVVGQHWTEAAWWGALMGCFSFVANASMYKGYAVGKASLIALMTGLPPLVVVLGAFFLWEEKLGAGQLAGFAVVLIGLVAIRYSSDLRTGQLRGLTWGFLTMVFFGFTDLTSKQSTISDAATLPTLIMMYATGTLLFAGQWLLDAVRAGKAERPGKAKREIAASAEQAQPKAPSAVWPIRRTVLWGMTVGLTNIAGMMFLIPAFRDGATGIVSALGAMNAAIVLAYAKFCLKEEMRRTEAIGMALALGGIVVMRLAS